MPEREDPSQLDALVRRTLDAKAQQLPDSTTLDLRTSTSSRRPHTPPIRLLLVAAAVLALVIGSAYLLTRGDSASRSAGTVSQGVEESPDVPPRAADGATGTPGDHWHAYLGVDICGEWLPNVPVFEQPVGSPAATQNAGIHSHGDGLIHVHPFTPAEAGTNATLGKFAHYAGITLDANEIEGWTGPASAVDQRTWRNGDACPFGVFAGRAGRVVWAVDGVVQTGSPSDHRLADGETIAVAFLPEGTTVDVPPGACAAFADISDQQVPEVVSAGSPCRSAPS